MKKSELIQEMRAYLNDQYRDFNCTKAEFIKFTNSIEDDNIIDMCFMTHGSDGRIISDDLISDIIPRMIECSVSLEDFMTNRNAIAIAYKLLQNIDEINKNKQLKN